MAYFQLHFSWSCRFCFCVLKGIRNFIEIVRFSSWAEFELSGDIFIRKVSQNQGKQKNVRDIEEFALSGSRDIEVQLYNKCARMRGQLFTLRLTALWSHQSQHQLVSSLCLKLTWLQITKLLTSEFQITKGYSRNYIKVRWHHCHISLKILELVEGHVKQMFQCHLAVSFLRPCTIIFLIKHQYWITKRHNIRSLSSKLIWSDDFFWKPKGGSIYPLPLPPPSPSPSPSLPWIGRLGFSRIELSVTGNLWRVDRN